MIAFVSSILWRLLSQLVARSRSSPLATSSVGSLAQRELDRLDYSTALQSKSSVGWKLGIVTANCEDQISLTERESTDADMVGALSWFFRELGRRTRRRILVCIDELDKIDSPDDVISVINGVKDLFHIPGVHVVVSVSTDAMH